MLKEQKPEKTYTITERNYNILQSQIMEIQNMLLCHDHRILVENALYDLATTLRTAIIPQKQK